MSRKILLLVIAGGFVAGILAGVVVFDWLQRQYGAAWWDWAVGLLVLVLGVISIAGLIAYRR